MQDPEAMQVTSMTSRAQLIASNKVILLFYRVFERDKYVRHDRYLQRLVRPLYNLTHHRQKETGFDVSFNLLKRALVNAGWVGRSRDDIPNFPSA